MKKQRTMMIKIAAFLVMVFSIGLIVMNFYFLSKGFSYHLSSGAGITISIICIVIGFILALGDAFIILFVYLPSQRKKQREAIRDIM